MTDYSPLTPQQPPSTAIVPIEPVPARPFRPFCDMCQGIGHLRDATSPTGNRDCPLCHGEGTNYWREGVATSKYQRLQGRQLVRLLMWVAILFFFAFPLQVKGMWPFEILLGLLFLKFMGWGIRQTQDRSKGSLT
jgi:hypothetical protein